jgi:hypothetical protein
VVEEVAQRLVGPVQVLHDQHRRGVGGQGLAEPPPGRERLLAPVAPRPQRGQADQRAEVAGHPGRLALVGEQVGDRAGQLAGGAVGRVGLLDAGLGLDDLAQGPEGHPLPVRQAAPLPPDHRLRVGLDPAPQLEHQPALADPRLPDQGHQPGLALGPGPGQGRPEQPELAPAAHQGAPGGLLDVDPEAAADPLGAPDGHRGGLALDPDRGERLVVDQPAGRPEGRLADQDATDRGDGLQPGGGVGHVPGEEVLAPLGDGVQQDHRLTGGDRDPDGQAQPGACPVEPLDRLDHVQGRPDRPLGVVLVRRRDAEHPDDRVPDELLDGAAVAFDLPAGPVVVGAEAGLDLLGVGLVGRGGEPDQVADEHADDLALLTPPAGAQRGGAGQTEAGPLGIVLATPLADDHADDPTQREPGTTRSSRRSRSGSAISSIAVIPCPPAAKA